MYQAIIQSCQLWWFRAEKPQYRLRTYHIRSVSTKNILKKFEKSPPVAVP